MTAATSHTPHHRGDAETSLTRTAFSATVHCLTGCAIGEILGMVLSTWWGWSNTGNVVLSVSLAFVFGYSLTMLPLLRSGLTLRRSVPLAFASDTLSIGTMELFDTLIILIVPGAIDAGLGEPLFWGSLSGALFVAFWAAFPVNRALIARGKGHAVIHAYHSATTPTRSRSRQSPQCAHMRSESRAHADDHGWCRPPSPHRDRAVGS
jgi:uncharacterized protein DUF4396